MSAIWHLAHVHFCFLVSNSVRCPSTVDLAKHVHMGTLFNSKWSFHERSFLAPIMVRCVPDFHVLA
jgi:hypothetical protein